MRLLALHLERYGPFTGRSLAFRRDARLHIVLGPNEAGKSTALAAVGDLLFGFEKHTRFAFLHDMPELRVGAEIEGKDGSRLPFRRRKGNRNTLIDADDAPLPEDALAPFLNGIGREVFCRAFGLDARGLREGGREMLDIEGEVGASLFAAGSGLRGLTDLQKSLEEEAQGIFAPRRAQGRSFYQALDRYDAARKAIRETELREGSWRELNEEITAAGAALSDVAGRRERIAAECARLERLKRVAPLIAGIDEALARAEGDPALVEAGDSCIDRLGALLAALRAAEGERARVEAALAAARADLASLPPQSDLSARAEDILEAFRGTDRFDKDGIDLPRLQSESARLTDELDRLATRIGLPDAETLARRQPADAARARLEAMIREGEEIAAALARIARERSTAEAERDGLVREQAASGAPVDPAPLREALKPLLGLRGLVSDRLALDATIGRAEGVLRGQAARLTPPVTDRARLASAPLPTTAVIARYRTRFDELAQAEAVARQRGEAAQRSARTIRERMREREAGRPIASRADLAAARETRNQAFAAVCAALAAGSPEAAQVVARHERAVHHADRLADDLAADAARVAEQAADGHRLDADDAESLEASGELAWLRDALAETEASWRAAWHPAGFLPGPPAEMAAWLLEAETLIEAHDDLEARRVDAALLSQRIEAARAPLLALAARAGLVDPEGFEAGMLLERVEDRIAALGRHWEATREADARLRAASAGIARLDAAFAETKVRQDAWREAWREAAAAIGLAAEARIEEAVSALAAWREVPAALRERESAERRVNGLMRDREAYRVGVTRLLALAPDVEAETPSAAIRALHKRLQAAQAIETRRAELAKRHDAAERSAAAASRDAGEARAALGRLLADVVPEMAAAERPEIEALLERLSTRRQMRAQLEARRAELTRAADGLAEAGLRQDLAATSMDAIAAELGRLAAEQEANDRRGQLAFSDRDRHERRRSELEGGAGAELAAVERKAAEAELAAAARQWAVLKFAQLMLGAAVARHRSGQQDPLLTRAGALFCALTGGGFSGLAQDYGEGDEPRIVGRRGSGAIVPVEGLSEGTRDQLYLALRLAHLEDYAARAEPAPFIGDDLFITFDDARTAHGLEALASIGESVQPILFTHHGHVAELAKLRLGEAVDVIRL